MKLSWLVGVHLFAAWAVAAQDYEIRLHRPHRVGEKEKVSIIARQTSDMSALSGGQTVKSEKRDMTVELDGVCTVLAVSPKGKMTRASYQIGKLTKLEGGVSNQVLPRDTVVVVSRSGNKKVFEVDGKVVEPEVAEVLGLVISGPAERDRTDDELFGTRERKRVGESWPISEASLKEMLSNSKMEMKEMSGKVTLMEVLTNAPGPRLFIIFQITGKPTASAPEATLTGTMDMNGSGEFPLDLAKPRVKEKLDMTLSTRVKRGAMDVRMELKQSLTSTTGQ